MDGERRAQHAVNGTANDPSLPARNGRGIPSARAVDRKGSTGVTWESEEVTTGKSRDLAGRHWAGSCSGGRVEGWKIQQRRLVGQGNNNSMVGERGTGITLLASRAMEDRR